MPEPKGLVQEFKEFILRGNVIDLAVAVVIGQAFGLVVKAFVTDILTPLVAAVFGKPSFQSLFFTIHRSRFLYGDVFNNMISFLSVAVAVFLFVVKPVNTLMARFGTGPAPDAPTKECPECLTKIPAPARRCAACTAAQPV